MILLHLYACLKIVLKIMAAAILNQEYNVPYGNNFNLCFATALYCFLMGNGRKGSQKDGSRLVPAG